MCISSKSIGTLSVICAVDELKSPLPVKHCCLKVIRISLGGRGLVIVISAAKKRTGVENSYHCMVFQGLLADIV